MKKVLSLLLVLTMLVGMISAMSISTSAATNITITGVDDWMSKLSGKTVGAATITVTAAELDFAGKTVKPVMGFQGTFDGQGVVIKNLTIVGDSTTGDEAGLFGCVEGPSTFKNFAILSGSITGVQWVGGVACCANGNTVAENIYIGEDVTITAEQKNSNSYAAGLFGGFTGTITECRVSNCVFAGTVTSTGKYNGGFVGALNKAPLLVIENSIVTGKVTNNKDDSCGFVGGAKDAEITMTNCIYAGGAEDDFYYNRPFFRRTANATVTNCYTAFTTSGKVYNDVKCEDENSGVTLITLTDLVGTNVTAIEGFTTRNRDIMLPTAIVSLFGDKIPSTSDKYNSKYTITWKHEDGTVLATEEYDFGETPTFKGEEPTKEGDETYNYTFSGWTPDVTAVNGDTEYTAKFVKVRNIVADEEEEESTKKSSTTTKPATTTATTTATTSATTDAAKEEGGCGSVIGGGILMLALLAGGATVVCKKKED